MPAAVRAEFAADAAARAPREACGLVYGRIVDGVAEVVRYRALPNIAALPTRAFRIDPLATLAEPPAPEAGGEHCLGVFHSHPDDDARPSARDVAEAWPEHLQWIGAFDRAGRFELRAFAVVATPHGRTPRELPQLAAGRFRGSVTPADRPARA